jgi:hypothetical protein
MYRGGVSRLKLNRKILIRAIFGQAQHRVPASFSMHDAA